MAIIILALIVVFFCSIGAILEGNFEILKVAIFLAFFGIVFFLLSFVIFEGFFIVLSKIACVLAAIILLIRNEGDVK